MKAAAEGPMKGYPRVLRGPDRLGRRRGQPGVVGVRLAPDHGHGRRGHVREVRLVVRQRVGLLEPRHGPHQAHVARRRLHDQTGPRSSGAPFSIDAGGRMFVEEDHQGRRRRGQARARARGLQRAARRGRGHRRHARPRGAAHDPLPRRPRRARHPREPPRPPEGRARPAVLAAAGAPRRCSA